MSVCSVPGPVLINLHDLFKVYNNLMEQVVLISCKHYRKNKNKQKPSTEACRGEASFLCLPR